MTPFNLRSLLLLAAIFLSNCISWTASRHHYTHNVNGHRSRHRRQGAGLFLSGSYILPGGEGSGWGEWGDISPCSRTCGGGVASQKRICLQIGPDGQPLCSGGDTKYFSCQTQDCPAGSKDFRAEQCSEFDDQLFWGNKYHWVPYTKAPKPCELNCMPHAERFYFRHKDKVIDGTPCPDSFDICVNGTCQLLGCDMMLGSSAKEDKCRVCRGNNANCHTTTGFLDTAELTKGYVNLLLIPEGSTNIVIEEVKPSTNYLALRAANGTFYLNGNYHIAFPRNLQIAGAMWTYERSEFGFAAPDKLRCLGPITEQVYLTVLVDENVGIEYEYSLPSDKAPPQSEGYNWVHGEFTPCTVSCGGGFQTRDVSCRSREKLGVVDEKLCDEGLRPTTSQICNLQACDPQWVPGAWGKCSKRCGMGGTSSREVTCQKVISNGYPSIVADSECFDLLGPKPKPFQKCNENATCPTWFTGPWKPCNKRCDEGQQSRQVVCYQKTGRRIEVLEDDACEETRPAEYQACMVQPCDGVDWVASEWNGCDSCQSTVRTRTVVCATKNHVVVEDRFCSYHHNISTREDCSAITLPPCHFQWYATQWSNCSALCGKGLQSRRVFCGQFDGSSVMKVADSKCSDQPKYNDTKPCEVPKEQCPMQWFSAPWSACSVKCGGGTRTRRVMCLQGEEMAESCPGPEPTPNEDCNPGPCDKVTAAPPYELEECSEEEPYAEVGLDSDSGLTMYSDSPEGSGSSYGTTLYELEANFTTDTASEEFITIEGSGSTWTDTTFVGSSTTDTGTEETGSGSTTETLTDDTEADTSTETAESTAESSPGSTNSSTDSTITDSSASNKTWTTPDYTAFDDTVRPTLKISFVDDLDYDDAVTPGSGATLLTGDAFETMDSSETTTVLGVSTLVSDGSTETTESGPTETTETTESSPTETTETTESGPTETTETTESGPTETTETTESSPTETTETTESGPTETTETTESSPTETTETTESSPTETTETTESGPTETTETTESGPTETTETTESSPTETTETTESSPTETTETTESGPTETTETTESSPTETTETTEYNSTENTETTEFSPTESDSTDTTETTESSPTETTETTESNPTETTETTESSPTETTESDSTDTTETTESSPTETTASDSTETTQSGPTETTETTESGATETSESDSTENTETTETGLTEITETSSTETTESDSTETTESGPTETTETTESGPTETTETTESGTTETTETTESSPTETTETDLTETTETTVSSPTETTETTESEPTETTETTESGPTETTESDSTETITEITSESTAGSTTDDDDFTSSVVEWFTMKTPRMCKPTCNSTTFGCCPDRKTAAGGPFDEGCDIPKESCKQTTFGCCPDGVSPAPTADFQGCPLPDCSETLFGCCLSDNKTAAEGNDQDGCPPPSPACESSEFGCCVDGKTEATGPAKEGCPETTVPETEPPTSTMLTSTTPVYEGCQSSEFGCCFDNATEATGADQQGCPCGATEFGCCPDGVSPAQGSALEGCLKSCNSSAYGCCPDGKAPAHGPNQEGCCLHSAFGCCRDNYNFARGPHFEGCECQYSPYGCCPNNVTSASGYGNKGCGCSYSPHGCCPDAHTEASGPEFQGCGCHTYQFGCCPDGVTIARGPDGQGCDCRQSKFKCCGDGETHATGLNHEGCDCSSSKFGCCPDGLTEATGSKFQGCTDAPVNKQAACGLPFARGPCRNYSVYWYFDTEYGGCSRFWYGGCEGNDNRFATKEECDDVCVSPPPKEACKLPQSKGACYTYSMNWYYDTERESCVNFAWGGCLGNNNNFKTRELCEKQCEPEKSTEQCSLPIEQGSCAGNFPRWGFNQESRACEQFVWGGCEGNSNRFSTEAACNLRCNPPGQPKPECSQPQVKGTCNETEAVWFFSQSENRCVPFYYSGCGGNGNRFTNQEDCEESCPRLYVPDKCTLPYETGDCANYSEKWYFDTKDQRCRPFYYGGCGGNKNHFASEQLCQNECQPIPSTTTLAPTVPTAPVQQPKPQPTNREAFCFLELDVGPCTEFKTSWGYDYKTGRCTTFQYGGCGGNRNNFPEEHYCQYYCRATQDICQLPMLQGPCDGSQMRWFYDTSSDSCSQFTYGGCDGNDNRFESRRECESRCKTGPVEEQTTVTTTVVTRPEEVIPQNCLISSTLEACSPEQAGEYWYLNVAKRECVPHENPAEGDSCRTTGVFSSQEGCERSCGSFRGIDVCVYPPDAGTCNNFVFKYFFNGTSGQCQEFAYGGCMGGPNRFSTEQECVDVCKPIVDPCKQQPDPGNCLARYEMWYYSEGDDQCRQFIYGGCGGNDNRFETEGACEGRCKHRPGEVAVTTTSTLAPVQPLDPECVTPAYLEPCGANETVFYYDSGTSTCRAAELGNCGQPNRYETEEECERRCGAFRELDVCRTQVDPGPCSEAIIKYYFDAATGVCQQFAYGGCQGGPNRFSTIQECEDNCREAGPAPTCLQEVATGESCGAVPSRRWYYSSARAGCLVFAYQGCGGNDNNFLSYDECATTCNVFAIDTEAALCDTYRDECEALESSCDRIQISVVGRGCRRCSCEEPPRCDRLQRECEELRCSYGVERIPGSDGCESCKCLEDPCSTANCSTNERCVASAYRDSTTQAVQYSAQCVPDADPPLAPQPSEETEPEQTATQGGNATLRCIFHGNPPPQISWHFGEIRIDGDRGRYRLLSDGALEIVALVQDDSGVYVCVAYNQLGTAQQEIRLVVSEASPCDAYNEECVALRSTCQYSIRTVVADGSCQRCSCEERPSCDRQQQECDALICPYGVTRVSERDGCESCKCVEDPCSTANCSTNERCVASAYRDPATQAVQYSAHCVPDTDTNEVLPECEQYEEYCAQLSCPYSVQKTMTSRGCVQCACVQEEVNCEPLKQECDNLKCNYGIGRSRGEDGCERCNCLQHPCINQQCADTERCVITPYHDPVSLQNSYVADCRSINKTGVCPADSSRSTESSCRSNCRDDADCRGVGKCCVRGCSKLCLSPDEPTPPPATPTTTLAPMTQHVTTYRPDIPRAPQASSETEPELTASEGGKAVLRCIFHGFPPPQITWNFGEITIDGDRGRYRLLSDGALEIVALVQDDSGVYVCVAYNQLGTAQQEIRLVVSDPVPGPAHIAADVGEVLGEMGSSLEVRCRAYGYPEPAIYWYRGINGPMVPYSNTLYEARGQVLTIRSLAADTLGEYACYAYNGKGKPATWVVTVRGYQPDDNAIGPYYVPRDRVVAVTPPERTTHTSTTSTTILPDIQAPPYIVPVTTELLPASTTISAGTELSLPCNVDGNPEPRVTWTKDGVALAPTDTMWVTGTRLTIPRATISDSGVYGCHASNVYSSHTSTVQITVKEIVIPSKCTDSAYFANCALIVQGKFCRHKYYSKFCCKSCVEAGQLDPNTIDMQSDEPYRKK